MFPVGPKSLTSVQTLAGPSPTTLSPMYPTVYPSRASIHCFFLPHLFLLPEPSTKPFKKQLGPTANSLQFPPTISNFSKFFQQHSNFHPNFFHKKFPNIYKSITFSISPINNYFYILLGPLTGYIPNYISFYLILYPLSFLYD